MDVHLASLLTRGPCGDAPVTALQVGRQHWLACVSLRNFVRRALHDMDVISSLLGERTSDTAFALGSALCPGKTVVFLSGLSNQRP